MPLKPVCFVDFLLIGIIFPPTSFSVVFPMQPFETLPKTLRFKFTDTFHAPICRPPAGFCIYVEFVCPSRRCVVSPEIRKFQARSLPCFFPLLYTNAVGFGDENHFLSATNMQGTARIYAVLCAWTCT
ncbi:hypothetical protein QBC45DRAFT_132852 [Copromyces sp. CBS 386.78]|nr:hypothetical protein QBC45DRAFT_132852 [Copromyces sp. CBS 386.78]